MKFFGYYRSSSSYRCRIAFNLKGVDYDFVSKHLRRNEQKAADFTALNPQALLPALETDDGHVLTQSLAIIEWLNETRPEPRLLPADPVERAQARAFALAIACEVHPLQNLRVLDYVKTNHGQNQAGADAWCGHWIGLGLEACEALVVRRGRTGPFCFGDEPSLADICLVPQVYSAERFGVDTSRFPRLMAIHAACGDLDAFAAAHPARQPDAEAA